MSFNQKLLINFYNLIWILLTPLIPILLGYRLITGKEEISRIKERFGYPTFKRKNLKDKLIWIHAASLGEVVSATSLAIGLKNVGFKGNILITSGTKVSSNFLKEYRDIIHQYNPLDKKSWVTRFLKFWKPDIFITVESEVWPNLIICTKMYNIPVIMASAQVSDKSFKRFSKIGFENTSHLFKKIDIIFSTDKNQTIRFKKLGAKKVFTSISLKVSLPPRAPNKNLIEKFNNISSKKTIILAASTRKGEEKILIDAIKKLNRKSKRILLIIAPRHIKRAHAISKSNNLNIKIKSKGEFPNLNDEFWISDTYGEMPSLYSLSEIVFVGGSLYPYGGHNPSEACHYNTKIIIGPYTEKCEKIVDQMKRKNALTQLKSNSISELTKIFQKLLRDNNSKNDGLLLAQEWENERNKIALNIITNFNLFDLSK